MRYRIYNDENILDIIVDRPSFDNVFLGSNPNTPIGGFLVLYGILYIIKQYVEYHSEGCTENEFHESVNDWFADVTVDAL